MKGWSSLLKKIKTIASGALARVISSFGNLIISIFIVRLYSPALWGDIVSYILILDFAFSFINWGSSPYLLRQFSLQPASIKQQLNQSISSRVLLLLIFSALLFLRPFDQVTILWIIIWSFFRFLYSSFDPLIQFERNYMFLLVVELISILIVVLPLLLGLENIDVNHLIILFTVCTGWKAIACLFFFRKHILFQFSLTKKFLINAFPFLLLTFSAMLQQRADLFTVAYFLPDSETARYQVFVTLLIFAQFLASMVLSPFAKNIYRLSAASFKKLELKFILVGIPLTILSALGIYVGVILFYQFSFNFTFYLLGCLYIYMFYLYLPQNYILGKENRQMLVSVYSFIASGVNVVLSILLTPKLGIEGALMSSLFSQIVLAGLYHRKRFVYAYR